MSKKVSKAEYKSAQDAQKFFSDSLNLLVEGKSADFLDFFAEYIAKSRQQPQDIFESYQTDGKHLLHIAASTANRDVVEFALKCPNPSMFVNIPDSQGFTPLMNATVAESSEIMSLLIESGADVNARNNDGATALHFAAGDGSLERMDILCAAGSDMSLASVAGSPIAWAAGGGKADAVRHLAGKGCSVDAVGANGIPAVLMAAVAPSEECVVTLTELGADVGHILTGQLTLLHICAEQGMGGAVAALLRTETGQKTAKVVNDDGNLPLHLAAMSSHEEIIRLLVPHSGELPSEYFSGDELCMRTILADGEQRLEMWKAKHTSTAGAAETGRSPALTTEEETAAIVSEEDLGKSEQLKSDGNDFFREKKYQQALEMYTQAVALNPHNHALWSNRSACYLSMAELKESGGAGIAQSAVELKQCALKDAEVCRRLKPDWPKGCFRLAAARLALGLYEDSAVAAYEGCQLDDENIELKSILKKAVKLGQEEHRRLHKTSK